MGEDEQKSLKIEDLIIYPAQRASLSFEGTMRGM